MYMPRRTRRTLPGSGRGFSLIEVMVGLAIVSVALFAALRASGAATANSDDYRLRLLARWVAGNTLATAQLARPLPPLGETRGEVLQAGERFVWLQTVAATPNPRFRRVDVVIRRAGPEATRAANASGGDSLASLSGFVVQE